MSRLQETLDIIKLCLSWAEAMPDEWTIFGSTSLVLRGILDREPGDIDMFVSRRVWGQWLAMDDWYVETPKAGDPPILTNGVTPIPVHAFFAWENEHCGMDVSELLRTSETVNGFRCIPVCDALNHKKFALAGNPELTKHAPDIAMIERWMDDRSEIGK